MNIGILRDILLVTLHELAQVGVEPGFRCLNLFLGVNFDNRSDPHGSEKGYILI